MAFGPQSTADEVLKDIDLTGKVFVVTGSSAGLGAETVRALAKSGAEVVMAARNAEKNNGVAASIRAEIAGARLSTVAIDLADLGRRAPRRGGNPRRLSADRRAHQ